jgi:hypothetical protein
LIESRKIHQAADARSEEPRRIAKPQSLRAWRWRRGRLDRGKIAQDLVAELLEELELELPRTLVRSRICASISFSSA